MKHITKEMWVSAFTKCADPGDTVDEEIVDQFRNSMPPIVMGPGFLQAGEQHALVPDTRGRLRPTYITFRQTLEDHPKWVYCGTCFKGESVHQKSNSDPWAIKP